MARKKKATRKATVAQLPKGYVAIGGLGSSWPNENTKSGEAIEGVVTDYNYGIKTAYGTGDTLKLETADGTIYSVWNSAVLAPLFNEDYTDVSVWIRFDGLGPKKKGRSPAKLFTFAYVDE